MKKLSKETLKRRDEIAEKLRSRGADLEATVEGFNTKVGEAWTKLETALEEYNSVLESEWNGGLEGVLSDYNEAVGEANEWKQEVAQEIQDWMDERSDKWQESPAAEKYQTWKEPFEEEFQTAELERPENVEVEEPGELTLDDVEDVAELLGGLPEELAGD